VGFAWPWALWLGPHLAYSCSLQIQGDQRTYRRVLEVSDHVGADHGGIKTCVAKERLQLPDVHLPHEEMCAKLCLRVRTLAGLAASARPAS